MSEINPQAFFRFAAEHTGLLTDLYYNAGGISEAGLQSLIQRFSRPDSPSTHYIMDQLLNLGILETMPAETAVLEMTQPVRRLMAYLLRQQRLTSVGVIQAYLREMDSLSKELEGFIASQKAHAAARSLDEISDLLERLRTDSRNNRDAITTEAIKVKVNRERLSVRARFEIINRLWKRYLEPLRDIIDIQKAMDAVLDRLERLMADGMRAFRLDRIMEREFRATAFRLLRLRRSVKEDYLESLKEVEPLYQSLRRDSVLARGASLALERIGKKGLKASGAGPFLAISAWRTEGLIHDEAMRAYLYGLKGYQPKSPPPLPAPAEAEKEPFILPQELFSNLASSIPVTDLMAWLIKTYPAMSLAELLRAYARIIFSGRFGLEISGSAAAIHSFQGYTITCYPVGLKSATDFERDVNDHE